MNRALRAGAALVPPLLVFVAVRWLLASAAASVGFDAWQAASWVRWDARHYMAIASTGYEYFSCARIGGRPWEACGNAAWFPLSPWAMRPLIALGLRAETAGLWISAAAALGSMVALWNAFLRRAGARGWLLLGLAAVFPGAVYQHAIFPTSLALRSESGEGLLQFERGRVVWAGAGQARGEDALTQILRARATEFVYDPDALLMELPHLDTDLELVVRALEPA